MKIGKKILKGVAFTLILSIVLTALTLVYHPKWYNYQDKGQPAGFYQEPKNTIDVLLLGSCNMYSSFSPVMMYERDGITSYNLSCPDQEMSTTYHYIKEALKRQKPKVVVVEALFLMQQTHTGNREKYNRFALDYMPLSWNKIALAWETARTESAMMPQYDSTASSRALTFASYMCPLLRYHNRTDLTDEDVTYFAENEFYSYYKGGVPLYSYTRNDGNRTFAVFNEKTICPSAEKYFPKIKELCDKNGIALIVAKSPNYARWGHDDSYTAVAREFAESYGVPFVDMHAPENNNFEDYDYGQDINLNVYGMRKFTYTLADYLIANCGLQPTELTAENAARWDESVAWVYDRSLGKGLDLEQGHLAQLFNKENAVCVRWNPCLDCDLYSIYRAEGHDESKAVKIGIASGETFDDTDVTHAQGYTYYVVPEQGAKAGVRSNSMYDIFVSMPTDVEGITRNDGAMKVTWDGEEDCYFRVYRRYYNALKYTAWLTTEKHRDINGTDIKEGKLYTFRVSAAIKEDGVEYQSESVYVDILQQGKPVVTGVSSTDGKNTVTWDAMKGRSAINIYRRGPGEKEFTLLKTISGSKTSYTDGAVKSGEQYYYRITSTAECAGVKEESAMSAVVGVVTIKN
ncbi:MAG: hypothetical protein II458_05980 [Oscillospiraceae bacterium]|nr:hypothetical protein [Oscillospiraceae bacterium]